MNRSDIERYRSLGHRELMAVLEANTSMGLEGSIVTSVALIGLAFLLVVGVSHALDRVLGAMWGSGLTPGKPKGSNDVS